MNGSLFRCQVSNAAGSVSSAAATLTVTQLTGSPTIKNDPQSYVATVGGSAVFSVKAAGTKPLHYQWQKISPTGTVTDVGDDKSDYRITKIQLVQNGERYQCRVSNAIGSTTSLDALLTVN